MINKYIDKKGLAYFKSKFETWVNTQLSKKAPSVHTHTKSQISDFPTSLPANGGDASTVNGHTVDSNVPSNAKFTDTIYALPTASPSTKGGIFIGYSATGKNYPVVLDPSGKAYVVVPWTDTVYSHPSSHPADMIAQDVSHRFITDQERSKWNNMESKLKKAIFFK